MAISTKGLAVSRVVRIAAIFEGRLVVNLKAAGFLASLTAPPSGVQ